MSRLRCVLGRPSKSGGLGSIFMFVAALAMPATMMAKPAEGRSPTLQVQVNVPPAWEPMLEDDLADAFVSRVRTVFRQEGYSGDIKEVTAFDEPGPGCCLLTINLIEWRMGHVRNIECTFTATLQTEKATRNLGIFHDMVFRWMELPGRLGLAESFGQAAEGAIGQLYGDLAKTELIPGLRRDS